MRFGKLCGEMVPTETAKYPQYEQERTEELHSHDNIWIQLDQASANNGHVGQLF